MTEHNIPNKTMNLSDLEQLGLINQGLFTVDGELAQRYKSVLKEVFSFECDLDSFRVDKRGLSPEIAQHLKQKYPNNPLLEFGENYLNIHSANRFVLIVSPDQREAPLVFPQTSYENGFIDAVYKTARHTIEDLTESSALFGEMDNGISVFRSVEDLLQFRTVRLTLDTLEGIGKSIQELQEMSEHLGDNDNALDPEYIERMRKLVEKSGNVQFRNVSDIFPIKKEVHCFYVEFFRGVHCLRNFKTKDDTKTIFISHHQETEPELGSDISSYDLHDKKLLKVLQKYGFLKYDSSLIDQRISEIEDEVLLAKGLDVISLPAHQRKTRLLASKKSLPKVWDDLSDLKRLQESSHDGIETAVEEASYETRLKLAAPASKKEIIYHMLAELDPTDTVRVYQFNPRKFRVEFPALALNRQRYQVQILNSLKGGSE